MKISSFLPLAAFGLKTILFKKSDPILGTIIVTDRCNLHCKHCSVNNITSVLYPYAQIRREMEQLYSMGIRILFFCGGETFLWRDGDVTLRDLVIEAKRMGFLIVNVVTNGTSVAVRPEDVTITRGEVQGQISGDVRTIMVLGHFVEVNVEVENRQVIKTYVARNVADQLHMKDRVSLSFAKTFQYCA